MLFDKGHRHCCRTACCFDGVESKAGWISVIAVFCDVIKVVCSVQTQKRTSSVYHHYNLLDSCSLISVPICVVLEDCFYKDCTSIQTNNILSTT